MSRLFAFRSGDPIPRIEYNEAELSTWKAVFDKVEDLLPGRACLTHRKYLDLMKKECSFSPDNIPQLEDLSNFLKSKTIFLTKSTEPNQLELLSICLETILETSGFTLRPAAGLITARDFLASLAFRVFQCTQYVRHSSMPHHSPEP